MIITLLELRCFECNTLFDDDLFDGDIWTPDAIRREACKRGWTRKRHLDRDREDRCPECSRNVVRKQQKGV